MRYPVMVVLVVGGIFLLAWLVSGRRIPVLVHTGAIFAALATIAFLSWLHSSGKEIEPVAWIAVILMPVLVYVTFAFTHTMHGAEHGEGTMPDAVVPDPVPEPEPWMPAGPPDPLTPDEKARATTVQVWKVCWQLPDKDWDAYCLIADAAQRLYQVKQEDHLLKTWGRVVQRDPQTLLAWYEERSPWPGATVEEDDHRIAREILRRADAGVHEPLIIRT